MPKCESWANTDDWSNAIRNGALPAQLDNVTVMVNGQPAYIYVLTQGQINAIAPPAADGAATVTVTTPAGSSSPFGTNSQTLGPAFFVWPNSQPVATHLDGTLAVANGTFAGVATVAAHPGEAIILWGTGFGPTNPALTPGELPGPNAGAALASPVTVTVGGKDVQVLGAAISTAAGLYQVAIQLTSTADGSYPLVASVNGTATPVLNLAVVH